MSDSVGKVLKTGFTPNVITLNKPSTNNVNNVRQIAHKLCDKLNDPSSFEYFCKVAWHLSEGQIWSNLEQASGGHNPKAYFTFLCNLELKA